jgi:hypothetical protein
MPGRQSNITSPAGPVVMYRRYRAAAALAVLRTALAPVFAQRVARIYKLVTRVLPVARFNEKTQHGSAIDAASRCPPLDEAPPLSTRGLWKEILLLSHAEGLAT